MNKRILWSLLSLLVIFSLLLVACGGGDDDKEEATKPAKAEDPTDVPPPKPTEEPPPELTSITIAIPEDPSGFNPYVADTGYEQLLMELVLIFQTSSLSVNNQVFRHQVLK